jgi:hypothetical protein
MGRVILQGCSEPWRSRCGIGSPVRRGQKWWSEHADGLRLPSARRIGRPAPAAREITA